jgi:hypothetical protein
MTRARRKRTDEPPEKRELGDRFVSFVGLESGRCALIIHELTYRPDDESDPRPPERRLWNKPVGQLILPDYETAKEVAGWIR